MRPPRSDCYAKNGKQRKRTGGKKQPPRAAQPRKILPISLRKRNTSIPLFHKNNLFKTPPHLDREAHDAARRCPQRRPRPPRPPAPTYPTFIIGKTVWSLRRISRTRFLPRHSHSQHPWHDSGPLLSGWGRRRLLPQALNSGALSSHGCCAGQ